MIAITNTTVLTPSRILPGSTVIITDGRIRDVGQIDQDSLHPDTKIVDGMGKLLVPGFIDLQINGAFGHDFTTQPESIWAVAEGLTQYGVTGFLPTIVTSPMSAIDASRDAITFGQPPGFKGAIPIGLHLEGPFLNPQKKGAHNESDLRHPQLDHVVDWSPATGVQMATLAPELPGADWICKVLAERGILVGAGHSMASYQQAKTSINSGVRYGTHLFNAMPPFHHREPGLAGAVLADERVTAGIIADGLHLHPGVIKAVWQITQDGRLNLVTDAMAALGMPDGTYQLGRFKVNVTRNSCRLADGTLAGSVLSLDAALRNLISYTGCSLSDALRTVTATPAALLGLGNSKGQIAPGFDADLVLLNADYSVEKTFVEGELLYSN